MLGGAQVAVALTLRRVVVEDPLGAELGAAVRGAADRHVVAGPRVHGQVGLDRVPDVVLSDQVVQAIERPRMRPGVPPAREQVGVAVGDVLFGLVRRVQQPDLSSILGLDLAQPLHVARRRVRPEIGLDRLGTSEDPTTRGSGGSRPV